MRSVLTRLVFRRILHNEPILHRGCLYRRCLPFRQHSRTFPGSQRRTLFGWVSPPMPAKVADDVAALAVMKDSCQKMDLDVRLPEPEKLAKAWTVFFESRSKSKPINDLEAGYALKVLNHLHDREPSAFQELISFEALRDAMQSKLEFVPRGTENSEKDMIREFATALFAEIKARMENDPSLEDVDDGGTLKGVRNTSWFRLIRVLSQRGQAPIALDLVTKSDYSADIVGKAWNHVISGLKREGNLELLKRIPGLMKARFDPIPNRTQLKLGCMFAELGDMVSAKTYAILVDREGKITTEILHYVNRLLRSCIRYNDIEWGRDIVQVIANDKAAMRKIESWDIIFYWALNTGKSVDDIDRMMEVMIQKGAHLTPNIITLNKLIELSVSKKDPYLAERLLKLGDKWGIVPDETTYLLQMDYRLDVDDVEGARTAYEATRRLGNAASENGDSEQETVEELPVLKASRYNRLIQAMCAKKTYKFDTIMGVVDGLAARNGRFEPSTVAALAHLHLKREEYPDVIDLLTTHNPHFSTEERKIVHDALITHMMNRNNSIARVWDTYMILQKVFDEATRETRINIMNEFYARRRSDMAMHVFNHMRHHINPERLPNESVYCAAFIGIAKTKDIDSLEIIHNALKLDLNTDMNTKMYNALIIAYTHCERPRQAFHYWEQILMSSEGPSYRSLLAVLKACEEMDFGEIKAAEVWELVRRVDVQLTGELVAGYVGALAGNGVLGEAKKVVDQCEEEFGIPVDKLIVGKLFNATLNSVKQEEMKEWIKEKYPQAWADLEKLGSKKKRIGTRIYDIEFQLEP